MLYELDISLKIYFIGKNEKVISMSYDSNKHLNNKEKNAGWPNI